MRKNKFPKQLKKRIKKAYKGGETNISNLAKEFYKEWRPDGDGTDIDSLRRYISTILTKAGVRESIDPIIEEDYEEAKKRDLSSSTYYLVTWAQNNTPIHKEMWKNLLAYKNYLNAELSVILGRYKNPTSVFPQAKNESWDKQTKDYWDAKRHQIHPHLSIVSNMKIPPTRKYPLRGVKDFSRSDSVIVGHPSLHLVSEPILKGYNHQVLVTSGALTLPNYTDSALGAIGHENHKFGFVIVEIKDKEKFFIRQVEVKKDGSFVDLMNHVKNGKVTIGYKAKALICGDTHHWVADEEVEKINKVISEKFKIDNLVLHDVVDGESVNNHLDKRPLEKAQRFLNEKWSVEKELQEVGDWLEEKLPYNPIIVRSNHNDRFDNILNEDWRKDINNSLFYLEYARKTIDGTIGQEGVVNYYLKERFGDQITTLDYDDSYVIGDYEVSQHGHFGANGARGNPVSFRNLGIPIILGHTHTPYRANDCLYVGTNTKLDLGYNRKGMSSWLQSNVLITSNGKAQHILIVGGEFTTFQL